jgi:hypothetical protein
LERWQLLNTSGQAETIQIDITLNDSLLYKQPVHGRQLYKRAPSGTVVGGYNCMNAVWDDYVEQRKTEIETAK